MSTNPNVHPCRRTVKPLLYADHVPGDKAVLCMDCRTIWDIRFEACPACSSKACLHIIKALDRRGVALEARG